MLAMSNARSVFSWRNRTGALWHVLRRVASGLVAERLYMEQLDESVRANTGDAAVDAMAVWLLRTMQCVTTVLRFVEK